MTLTGNILTTLSARLIVIGLMLISAVVLARTLGPDGRGLFALALLMPEWGKNFGLLGFEQSNSVYAGLEPEKRRALVWQSAIIAGPVGAGIAVAGICFLALGAPGFPALRQGPMWLFVLPLLAVPAGLLLSYYSEILRGMNRIVVLNVAEVSTKVTSILLILVLVIWLRLGVTGAVWADVLGTMSSIALFGVLLKTVGCWGANTGDTLATINMVWVERFRWSMGHPTR